MNNADFRNLLCQSSRDVDGFASRATPASRSLSLGSKSRAAAVLTPRSVKPATLGPGGVDRTSGPNGRSGSGYKAESVAKGAKLASGYTDRAQARRDRDIKEHELSDQNARIQALREQCRLGQIDQVTFESLARKLRGSASLREDVAAIQFYDAVISAPESESNVAGQGEDAAFDELEAKETVPVQRDNVVKHGNLAQRPVAGLKRSRNALLAELRASRRAQEEKQANELEKGFSKVRGSGPQHVSSIERDSSGREVLVTVDEHGNLKRKVRKLQLLQPTDNAMPSAALDASVASQKPLAEPIQALRSESLIEPDSDGSGDDNIFADVDDDYDPLKIDTKTSSNGTSDCEEAKRGMVANSPKQRSSSEMDGLVARNTIASVRRNYFGGDLQESASQPSRAAPSNDPGVVAAIRRAAQVKVPSEEDKEPTEVKPSSTAAERLLSRQDRDFEDLDLGFGSSRANDEEDGLEEPGTRLSEWKDSRPVGDDGKSTHAGTSQRKRSKKKRKGDKNNAADVLRVMGERRK